MSLGEPPPLSQAQLYDILIREEAEFGPRDDRMWETVKIDPEKWAIPSFHRKDRHCWVVGIIGKRVLWYDEFERGFTLSNYETHGEIGGKHSPADVKLQYILMCLVDRVGGEQAYNR